MSEKLKLCADSTPGPWEAIGEWIREKGKPNLIGYASRDENGPMRSDSEQQANAKLMAAAPEMYARLNTPDPRQSAADAMAEALREMLEDEDFCDLRRQFGADPEWFTAGRAALAQWESLK